MGDWREISDVDDDFNASIPLPGFAIKNSHPNQIDLKLKSEFVDLFWNYRSKREEEFKRVMKIIENLDVVSKMKAALSKGYLGFTMFESEYLYSFSKKQKKQISEILEKYYDENNFKGLLIFTQVGNSIQYLLNIETLNLGDGEEYVISEPYKSYEDMEKDISSNWRNITKYSIYECDDNLLTNCVKQILNIP